MAEGLNRVMLLGNLGADPELRMTSGGQAVLKLRLATSETYMDRNKARQERTEWHNVVIWGKRAEALAKIMTKGTRIFVEGGLRTSSYDDRDGNKRYRTEIVAQNILLQGQGGRGGGGPGGGGGGFRDAPSDDEHSEGRGEASEGFRAPSGPAPGYDSRGHDSRGHDSRSPDPRSPDAAGQDFAETDDDDIPF